MRHQLLSSCMYLDGCKSDVNIYLFRQMNLKLNVLFRSLRTATIKTPVVSHDLEPERLGLVFICRLPNCWCIQDLSLLLPEQSQYHRSTFFQCCPLIAFWPEEKVVMDWLEGLGWAGVVAVAVSLFWDLFLPLNLFVIGVIYVSTFIGWLFLTRNKTSLWTEAHFHHRNFGRHKSRA